MLPLPAWAASATIAAEELIRIGAKNLIRIGSSAALDPQVRIGDLMISTAAMKNEGTSRFYVPDSFPAVPDLELTHMLIQTAKEMTEGTDFLPMTLSTVKPLNSWTSSVPTRS